MVSAVLEAVHDRERVAAVRRVLLLDTEPEEAFDRLTRLGARMLRVALAAVCIVDRDREFFKSAHGLPEPWATSRQGPLEHSVCQHAVASRRPVLIADTRTDPRTLDDPVIAEMGIIAYAGIPLVIAGHPVGAFCVAHPRPRAWTPTEVELLGEMAAITLDEIRLRVLDLSRRSRRTWAMAGSLVSARVPVL